MRVYGDQNNEARNNKKTVKLYNPVFAIDVLTTEKSNLWVHSLTVCIDVNGFIRVPKGTVWETRKIIVFFHLTVHLLL